MKYIFVVILSILVELSVQTLRNVVNNKTEETVDSKIVINVEYTNFQKKVNEVSNEKTNGKKLITETEDIVEEFFIATINPNETADSENEGTSTESFDDEESAPVVGTFRSDSNETAVSESSENKTCSENEIFIKCGPRCYQTCTFQSVNVRSSRVACDSPCIPGCYCASGYVRFNEKCVLPDSCPTHLCRLNEEYTECGTACPITCESYKFQDQITPACPEVCVPGCHCKEGYVKNYLGVCVLPTRCPRPAAS